MPTSPASEVRPHVVMLVGNDVVNDARVKKTAISLDRLGYRVTVVGRAADDVRDESDLAGVRVIRVPVPWHRRHEEARAQRTPSRWWRSERAARAAAAALEDRRLAVRAWRGGAARRGTLVRAMAAPVAAAGLLVLRAAGHAARIHRGAVRRWERRRDPAGPGTWRRHAAAALDYRDRMTPEVVALEPDVVHAHDVNMLPVADAAVSLLALQGRRVPWIYDAHEFVAGISTYAGRTALERAGWLSLERRLAPRADRIVTVSPALADELRTAYGTARPPAVVVNAPWCGEPVAGPVGGVRADVGLGEDVPLLVYSGGLTQARGVDTVLAALPLLEDVHLAVVPTPPVGHHVTALLEEAERLGVADRVHVAAPVPPDQVVDNLRTASLGMIPILRFPSHDVALTNKLFEYLHAGLPVVVSDCPAQAEFVRRHEVGTVHTAADPVSLAAAVRTALDAQTELRSRIAGSAIAEEWSWQGSERALAAVYADLPGLGPVRPAAVGTFPTLRERVSTGGSPSSFTAAGPVPPAVTDLLVSAGLRRADDEHAGLVVVAVENADGSTRTAWPEDVTAARRAGRRVALAVGSARLLDPWQASAGRPLSARLDDVHDRARVRTFDGLVLVPSEAVARTVPGAVVVHDARARETVLLALGRAAREESTEGALA